MRLDWKDIGYSVLWGMLFGCLSSLLCIRIMKILVMSSHNMILIFFGLSFFIPLLIGGYLIYWDLHKDDDLFADRALFILMNLIEFKKEK